MGTWEVQGGKLDLPFLQDGQYFRILGSVFNDGLHQYPASDLKDEKFKGHVCGLAIPLDFLDLVDEIEEWNDKYGSEVDSPFASESFGGYSYSLASDTTGSGAQDPATGWQKKFMARLIPYRKLC